MNLLSNKRIIVTGAGSGIGRASCELAAAEGAKVVAVDLAETVHDTVAGITQAGGQAVAVQADVSDEAAVAGFVERCVEEFGGVDGIYANAGVSGGAKPLTELTVEDWQRTLSINTVGVFLAIKKVVPIMNAAGSGSIVCTASVAGLRANAGGVDYSASKAGVISIVQTTAYQLYGTGIRVNAICPGLIETGMTRPAFERADARGTRGRIGQINPTARAGEPVEIAQMACFLLSDRASYVNGQAIAVDGVFPAERSGFLRQRSGYCRRWRPVRQPSLGVSTLMIATVMKILTSLSLLLALGSGCSGADESAAGAESATSASGPGEERLLAAPPAGWKEVFSSDNPGLRMVEFIPDDQVNATWQQKISFESSSGKPLPDPIMFLEGLSVDQSGTCDGFGSFTTFSGFENGYPTTLRLMVCKNSNIINQSQVTMLKAIQGKDNFYVISRAQRGPPLADDAKPLSEAEIAGWSLYLKAISLCDDSAEHPCPAQR